MVIQCNELKQGTLIKEQTILIIIWKWFMKKMRIVNFIFKKV